MGERTIREAMREGVYREMARKGYDPASVDAIWARAFRQPWRLVWATIGVIVDLPRLIPKWKAEIEAERRG